MSKWIVTVSDSDDGRMQDMADSLNEVWINEWVGEAVSVEEIERQPS